MCWDIRQSGTHRHCILRNLDRHILGTQFLSVLLLSSDLGIACECNYGKASRRESMPPFLAFFFSRCDVLVVHRLAK